MIKSWKNCRIKDTSKDPEICFNEIFNLNLNFKKIKAKYEKDEDDLKAHVFDILPEYLNQSESLVMSTSRKWHSRSLRKIFVGSGRYG